MERILVSETPKQVGQKVKVAGWVNVRRAHGKILFIDLRDKSGLLQCVFLPNNKEAYDASQELRTEWVVELTGEVVARPEKMVNSEIATGTVELSVEQLVVLSKAQTLPFDVTTDGKEINEEIRMKYRYVDLRRPRMKQNLIMRHNAVKFVRDFLSADGFVEIETPMLTKSTPEGSRDFVVPSRLQPGKFYALPQSPQQYKQLFMVAGIEKYFQIARAMRDEDVRGDRQFEHTQIDMELSFVQREDVMALNERMIIALVTSLFPEKKIQEVPFPRMSYKEAMATYNSDKPDIRNDKNNPNLLAFCWVVDFPFFEKTDEAPETGDPAEPASLASGWTFTHNPFSAPKPEFMQQLMDKKDIADILTTQYDLALNGVEVGGGSIRNHTAQALEKVFEVMGYKTEEIKEKFGHMMEAFSFGAPPHGGIAYGLDRLLTTLLGENSIREVIAFPKTGDGRDLMMQAPSELYPKQLQELHINVAEQKVKKTILKKPKKGASKSSS